jgi:hypothetical protein
LPAKNQEAQESQVQWFEQQGFEQQRIKQQGFALARLLSFATMQLPPAKARGSASVYFAIPLFDGILTILRHFPIMSFFGTNHGR